VDSAGPESHRASLPLYPVSLPYWLDKNAYGMYIDKVGIISWLGIGKDREAPQDQRGPVLPLSATSLVQRGS